VVTKAGGLGLMLNIEGVVEYKVGVRGSRYCCDGVIEGVMVRMVWHNAKDMEVLVG